MARLIVELISDASKFSKGFDAADKELKGFSKQAGKANQAFGQISGKVQATTAALQGLAAVAAGSALVNFARDAVDSATALGESVNAVNKVFGEGADTILEFGEQASSTVGLANSEFNQLAVTSGALLTNFGFAAEDAADEVLKLAVRASDSASVFNTDVSTALSAFNSALRGETEPIRQFGVSLNDAAIRAKAVELGLADTTKEVDDNGKAVAALELIYEQTDSAAGDFLQTQDDLANSARTAAAQWEDAKAQFGSIITPAATAGLSFVNKTFLSLGALFGNEQFEGALRLGEAVEYLNDAIRNGEDLYTSLANALFTLSLNGELNKGTLIALGAQVGITGDALDELGRAILEDLIQRGDVAGETIQDIAIAFGLWDEIAPDILYGPAIPDMAAHLEDVEDAAGGAADGLEDLDDAGQDVIGTGTKLIGPFGELNDELFEAQQKARGLGSALLEITDPAFRAAQAAGRLRDAEQNLADTQSDSQASTEDVADAALDYARAKLEAQAANEAFDTAGVENALAGLDLALEGTGFLAGELFEALGVLTEDDWIINLFIKGNVTEIPADPRSLFPEEDRRAIEEDAAAAASRQTTTGVTGDTSIPYTPPEFFPTGSTEVTNNYNTTNVINNPQTNDLEGDLQQASLLGSFVGAN